MYDRLPIKHFTARLEKLEKRYARELQRHLSIMENGETVVDLDKRRARMIAQGKRVRATNSSVTSSDDV